MINHKGKEKNIYTLMINNILLLVNSGTFLEREGEDTGLNKSFLLRENTCKHTPKSLFQKYFISLFSRKLFDILFRRTKYQAPMSCASRIRPNPFIASASDFNIKQY